MTNPIKILIVEDEIIIAEDMHQLLLSLGYEVIGIAHKYSVAVDLLERVKPDIILLDITLGGAKTGIDLAHHINTKHKIPFVFLTSHADAATVKKAKEVRPRAYLVKPFNKEDIYTTLEVALTLTNSKDDKLQSILDELSNREQDIYKALLEGKTDKEIGDTLFISLNTVKTHIKNIFQKLGVKNRLEAASLAHQ